MRELGKVIRIIEVSEDVVLQLPNTAGRVDKVVWEHLHGDLETGFC